MYLFDHLIVCTVIGFVASYFIKSLTQTETVISFALGGIISDLVDKPLYFFDGYGRSVFHSIAIVTIIFLVCMHLFRNNYKMRLVSTIFYAGIIIHQVMDSMWSCIRVWMFPLMGYPSEFCARMWSTHDYIYLLSTNINIEQVVVAAITFLILFIVLRRDWIYQHPAYIYMFSRPSYAGEMHEESKEKRQETEVRQRFPWP